MSILIRLIPHLYYFIREMYRRDIESPTGHKKRSLYRTFLSILIILLGGVIVHEYRTVGSMNTIIQGLETEVARCKEVSVISARDKDRLLTLEATNRQLTHKNDAIAMRLRLTARILDNLCEDSKNGDCSKEVIEFIHEEDEYLQSLKVSGVIVKEIN